MTQKKILQLFTNLCYMGFETLKNRFFHKFLYNSTTCQEYFPKVLSQSEYNSRRERFLKSPPIRISMGRILF